MRVAIDARPLSHPQAGGYRSLVRALLQGLAERAGDERLLLYIDRPLAPEVEASLPAGAQLRVLSPARLKTDFVLFPAQVRRDAPDLVFGTLNYLPPNLSAPTVLSVLDALLVKRYPWETKVRREVRQRLLDGYWATLLRLSARRARRIVTLSQGSVDELAGALGLPASAFTVVPCGVTLPPPRPGIVRAERRVLALAQPDPRKNVEALYDALSRYGDAFGRDGVPGLDLVCTSTRSAERAQAEVDARGLKDVRLLRRLDDQGLSDAYARATAFVYPSRLEGFGLPPVEAMQAGCPVAASNALPMPEVLGDAPVYFDPDDPGGLAGALATLLADPAERTRRAALGRERAARYTCRRMADAMVAVWKAALA